MIVKYTTQIILDPSDPNEGPWVNIFQNWERFRQVGISTRTAVFETSTSYISDTDVDWQQLEEILEEMKAEQERDAEEEHRQFMDTIDRWEEQRKENT